MTFATPSSFCCELKSTSFFFKKHAAHTWIETRSATVGQHIVFLQSEIAPQNELLWKKGCDGGQEAIAVVLGLLPRDGRKAR